MIKIITVSEVQFQIVYVFCLNLFRDELSYPAYDKKKTYFLLLQWQILWMDLVRCKIETLRK